MKLPAICSIALISTLGLVACGSDDGAAEPAEATAVETTPATDVAATTADPTTDTEATATDTAATDTTGTTGTTGADGADAPASGDASAATTAGDPAEGADPDDAAFCTALAEAGDQIDAGAGPQEVIETFRAIDDAAPEAIRGATSQLVEFVDQASRILELPPEEQQQAFEDMGDVEAEFEAAGQEIEAYAREACPGLDDSFFGTGS